MGIHRFKPPMSGRMGIFWTLAPIKGAAVVEFGCMGHNLYGGSALRRAGVYEGYGAPLYATYVDETDLAMGDTSRLEGVIRSVIAERAPEAIFLQPSAIPEVIGTDLFALAALMGEAFPSARILPIGRASFALSGHRGVADALYSLTEAFAVEKEAEKLPIEERREAPKGPAYNLIGSCPDLFRFQEDAAEIARLMRGAFGMEAACELTSGASVASMRAMGRASVNLVIRREGLPAARFLKERFGTPMVEGRPYGIEGTAAWLRAAGEALGREPGAAFVGAERERTLRQVDLAYDYLEGSARDFPEEATFRAGGHADVVSGIARFATEEFPLIRGECWCDDPDMASPDLPYYPESLWIPAVERAKKGYLMFTGEALLWAKKNLRLTISNPDAAWRIHPYGAPLVGFRGAANLVDLWMGEYALTH